jgi:hypothetical protein
MPTHVISVEGETANPSTGDVSPNYDSPATLVITTTESQFTIVADGVSKGTWDKILQPDSGAEGWIFSVSGTELKFSLGSYAAKVLSGTSVTVDGIAKLLGLRGLYAFLRDQFFFLPSPGSDKIYRALLFQTGTADPIAVTKGNTLGGTPIWTRVGIGVYKGTLVGAFPADKTICPPFGGAYGMIPLSSNSIADYYYQVVCEDGDEDNVYVYVYDSAYGQAELSAIIFSNSIYVEVIVIP